MRAVLYAIALIISIQAHAQSLLPWMMAGTEPTTDTVGLLHWWSFDETIAGAVDSHKGNNGAPISMGLVPGKVGKAYSFNGTSSYVLLNDATSDDLDFASDQDFSIGYWVNTSGGGTRVFFHAESGSGWIVSSSTTATTVELRKTGSTIIHPFAADNSAGEWHFNVVTLDRDGVATFYIDGELTDTWSIITYNTDLTSTNNYIGSNLDANYFNGLLDELFIYNKVLTPAQVKALYNYGNGVGYNP